jgi:FAD-dependent urate hydroxylase
MLDVAIVGTGPYGLSLAAHAKKAGLKYKAFGYPMDFWKSKMPPNMYIRTLLEYTSLADPNNEFTLTKYQAEKRLIFSYPLPRSIFVDYGLWFIKQIDILIEEVLVTQIRNQKKFFEIQTEKGTSFQAKNVIIAVGLRNAQYIPSNLTSLPKEFVSHTSNYTNFDKFKNKHVLVVGGGQSAWEAAALLHKSKAKVELAYRRPHRFDPDRNTNAKQQELADKFFYFSQEEKEKVRSQFEKPTVSDFLVPLVEGKVIQRPNTSITNVSKTKANKVHVIFNNQASIVVDHIIAATGYRFTPYRLPFLQTMIGNIDITESGEPVVNEYFESTVPNMFFAGPATAFCHGPAYRFIAGVRRTSDVLINHIKKQIGVN